MNCRGKRLVALGIKKYAEAEMPDKLEEPYMSSGSNYVPSDASNITENEDLNIIEHCNEFPLVSTLTANDHQQSPNSNTSGTSTGLLSSLTNKTNFYFKSFVTAQEENNNILTGRPKQGKKRKYILQNRKIRKDNHNKNTLYVSARGQEVLPKVFNVDFQCSCAKKCTAVVTQETRERFFTQFWTIGSYSARCALLNAHVKEQAKKRCYVKNKISRRNHTRVYFIEGIEVCKQTFLKTLQINQNRIEVALKKRCDVTICDNRGQKSGGKNKCLKIQTEKVVQHINSFPKYVSHYCRKDTNAKFLSSDLNLAKMYDLYRELKFGDSNPVSLSTYKALFYKHFNLKFKSPKKDTYLSCDKFKSKISSITNVDELEVIKQEHETHLTEAKNLRDVMNKDLKEAKTNPELETLTFDMQKTHPLPKLPTGIVYYKRQLNFYNLGIHVGGSGRGIFNVWTENMAGRGTQEVGSCLLKYINENIQDPVKELRLWSDSCGGQNRSIKLVLLLLQALLKHLSLEKIIIRFLLSGHSFLPNDSEFGDVESALKKQERLYTDMDYCRVMKKCRRKNKFEVICLKSDDFWSVDKLLTSITNRKSDVNKQKISWITCHEIEMRKASPNRLFMKDHLNEEPKEVNIEKACKGRKPNLQEVVLNPLWPNGKTLSNEKVIDIKEILKLVPADAKPFYAFLSSIHASEFDDDVEGFGPEVDFDVEGIVEDAAEF